MDIVVWLRSLGLGKYEAVFRENDIDETVLSSRKHGRSDTASSPSRANRLIAWKSTCGWLNCWLRRTASRQPLMLRVKAWGLPNAFTARSLRSTPSLPNCGILRLQRRLCAVRSSPPPESK